MLLDGALEDEGWSSFVGVERKREAMGRLSRLSRGVCAPPLTAVERCVRGVSERKYAVLEL